MNTSIGARTFRLKGLLVFSATVICASVAYAAPQGELDASFGANGRVTIGPAYEQTLGGAVAQQPADGKLIVAGATWVTPSGEFDFLVHRLNPDGSPDRGFGTDGAMLIDFSGQRDIATDLAIQADGKIIVAGYSDIGASNYDIALTRLNQDGSIDSAFGNGGRATVGLGGNGEYTAKILLLANGKIVVSGATNVDGDFDAVFARFNANGSLDASFGTGLIAGTTRIDSSGTEDQPYWMSLQSDGKLVACGQSGPVAYNTAGARMLAIRVNSDGSVDRGFGTNGMAQIATQTPLGGGRGCVTMPDGTTVLAGFAGTAGREDLLIARLASDGALDTSFGSAGFSKIDLGGSESLQSIVRLADGKLGVVGLTGVLNSEYSAPYSIWAFDAPSKACETLFARIDANSGLLDPDFGNNGVTLVDFGKANLQSQTFGRALIQQADGGLLAVGESFEWGDWWSYHRIALARVDLAGNGNSGIASFVRATSRITEGNGQVAVSVRRTGGRTGELAVNYTTVPDTAISPGDFTATSGTLIWPSGDTDPKTITVPITSDLNSETDEFFTVELSSSADQVGLAISWVTIDDNNAIAPSLPPLPAPPGNKGGGGAAGIEVALILAMFSALELLRRRRERRRPKLA